MRRFWRARPAVWQARARQSGADLLRGGANTGNTRAPTHHLSLGTGAKGEFSRHKCPPRNFRLRRSGMRSEIRLIEIGDIAHPPRIYLPLEGVTAQLDVVDKQTHCPLKGDAFYLALEGHEIGWSYKTLDFASQIQGLASDAPTLNPGQSDEAVDTHAGTHNRRFPSISP